MKGQIDVTSFWAICGFVIVPIVLFLACCASSETVTGDDLKCLDGLKNSLRDPLGKLTSCSFTGPGVGIVCQFVGVTRWNDRENRVLSLELGNMSLSGMIPESLKYCQSLQELDLSANYLDGTIPKEICTWLPYIVTLDLSNNNFSGSIPSELANCTFLNNLILSGNKLSGTIPFELSSLRRLTNFSVADNYLTGMIPSSLDRFGKATFSGNDGLCGGPLGDCGGLIGLDGYSLGIVLSCQKSW